MVSASPFFIVLVSFYCATTTAPKVLAFSPQTLPQTTFQHQQQQQRRVAAIYPSPTTTWDYIVSDSWQLASAASGSNHESEKKRESRFQIRKRLKNFVWKNPIAWSILTLIVGTAVPSIDAVLGAKPAMASAPVMAMPKAEDLDPGEQAMKLHQKKMSKQRQQELDAFAVQARKVEAEKGPAARAAFEKDFKAQKEQEAIDKANAFTQLKRELLDQGIDPYCDLEGQRQAILYETGLDMAEISGTAFNMEKIYQEKSPKKSVMYQKGPHRAVIRLLVQDMKNRGRDPLEYFESHKEQTLTLLGLPAPKIVPLLQTYQANMEEYGQVTKPAPGEMSLKEKMAAAPPAAAAVDSKAEKEAAAAKAKVEKERLKAEAKAEKDRLQAEAKAEKERLKAEATAAKEEAKRVKLAEKEKAEAAKKAAAAAATAAAGVGALAAAGNAGAAAVESAVQAAIPESAATEITASETTTEVDEEDVEIPVPKPSSSAVATKSESKSVGSPLKKVMDNAPVAALVVSVGAGAFGFKIMRDRSAAAEEERQRQFRLLMGGDGSEPASSSSKPPPARALDEIDDLDLDDASEQSTPAPKKSATPADSVIAPAAAAAVPSVVAKKRRLGIFKSKKDGRETDLRKLLDDNEATEFASLLGKILTFGAPGRFPNAISILGSDMPLEEFDLKKAEELLVQARLDADLDVSQSAEIFANVVNCMLIDIVDLASSSLKEKENKLMVDAINIVVDFMNHAASLYDAVAEGATITPVTYSGDLAKSKLEQMYSQYAVGGMMTADGIPDDFDSRVALLQDVFSINEKKAEGLMLKAMQKNMMEMMKNGGTEGMEGMMKNMGMDPSMMGGAGGMGGEGGMDPEQLKTMLLELKGAKERGEISKEELGMVREQFKQAFGASLDDLLKEADSASPEDKEVLELMKSVLE